MRRVTLVCGPPCGGKSTYVTERADPSSIVLDMDRIAQEMGSGRDWMHHPAVVRRANRRMRVRLTEVAEMVDGSAWVVRCLASADRRNLLAERLRAEVVVLRPPIEVVLERAAQRPFPQRTAALVRRWYAAYTPTDRDVVVKT